MNSQEQIREAQALRKEQQKLKVVKDLGFLLKIEPIFVDAFTAKYILQPGQDEVIKEIPYQFEAHIRMTKYDYQGRLLFVNNSCVVISKDSTHPLKNGVMSMRVKEKAWFNVTDQPLHNTSVNVTQDEQGGYVIEKENGLLSDDDFEDEENQITDEHPEENQTSGEHYQVILDRIQYKNAQSMQVKRLMYQQEREKGRKFFTEKKFTEALRVYKKLIHISEGVSKKKYTQDEIDQLQNMNITSRRNYLKSYFKLTEAWIAQENQEFAKQVVDQMVKDYPAQSMTLFLFAKWLLKDRMLDNALKAAHDSYKLEKNQATLDLIKTIEFEKKMKRKIKVPVELAQKLND